MEIVPGLTGLADGHSSAGTP